MSVAFRGRRRGTAADTPSFIHEDRGGWSGLWRKAAGLIAAGLMLLPGAAPAQTGATTTTYSNTTQSDLFGFFWTPQCVSRTFASTSTGFVTDVKLGMIAEHYRRGEVSVKLTAPSGTSRTLMAASSSTAQNMNVLFDDAASQSVTSYASAGTDDVAATPYQRTYRPSQTLAGFDGQAAAGTWTLEVCDNATAQYDVYGGRVQSAELTITSAQRADLSLTKTVSNSAPANGANVTYTLTLANASASSSAVTNVTVEDQLPAGTSFVSASTASGSYDPETGIWTVPSIGIGATRTLSIVAKVTATQGAPVTNVAEVASSPLPDPDSTPGNGVAGEDDRATATFTVSGTRTAGTVPNLVCPAGSLLFDWDGRTWNGGATSGNYNLTGLGTLNFALSNPGQWLNLEQLGGQTPRTGNAITGGYSPAQNVLMQAVNMSNRNQVASTVITLPAAVSGAQFRIFDVDYNENQFADRVRVTGSLNGVAVMPTLTNGTSNYVIGNEAFGDVTTDDNRANANVVVTFASAVDKIIIEYGNWSDAPSDPGQQAIAIHDITLCNPTAAISVAKTSQVASDSALAFNTPDADVIYTITVANSGPGAVTSNSLVVIDAMPNTATYVNAGTSSITFSDMGSGLSWNAGTDVRFSNATTPPTTFAGCTYSPTGQLDTNVRYICINPKGVMAAKTGSATPSFSLSFRARIR